HRDVAHKNVMLRWDGAIKLLDFGLVKRLDGPSLTREGFVKGTVDYMSPEQLRGEPLDARSDVFSLGLMLYELVQGAPIAGRADPTPPGRRASLPPIGARVKGLPAGLEQLLAKALEPNRDARTATARDFSRELSRCCADLLWEPEQIAAHLQALFGHERAEMEKMVAALVPDEVSHPNGRPLDAAEKRTDLVTPEQIRAALAAGPLPDDTAAATELKTAEEIEAALGVRPQPTTDPLMPPAEPAPRAPIGLFIGLVGAIVAVGTLLWWLSR
ncbi:MAG: protein kinase, partial [Myxococcaceae bacterium]|nr:protein kinase [Myxococcaceae bacterium]